MNCAMQGKKKHEAEQLSRSSETLENEWQLHITEKVNFLETKIISMDNGLMGAGENIKKILEHLQKSGTGVTTPPRKKQIRGPPLSPLQENQRSAISEIARAQRPTVELTSPRSQSHMYSHGVGEGTEGDDDETQGYENDVVDLADEARYIIPSTQTRRGKANIGRGKAVVVLDSQSGGEDDDTRCLGVRMEEYETRRPQLRQGQEERRRKTTGNAEGGRRRLDNGENGEENAMNAETQMQNMSEEEGDDSNTKTQLARRRNAKKGGCMDGRDAACTTGADGRPSNSGGRNTLQARYSMGGIASDHVARPTQTYRRTKIGDRPQSPKPSRPVGVASTEVPQTLRPRKNGVRGTIYSP